MKRKYLEMVSAAAEFLVSIALGAVMFLGLAVVALALDVVGGYLAERMSDIYVSTLLLWLGRILFTLDVVLLLGWTAFSFYQLLKSRR